MTRFLLCSVASYGFVYPMLGIAVALRAHGHDVAFVTDVSFEEPIRRAGFARLPRGDSDGPSFLLQHWYHDLAAAIQVKHIEYALGHFAADVLVGQPMTLGALLAGERKRLPVGIVGLASSLWPMSSRGEGMRERRLAWRYQDMLGYYNAARRLFGLAAVDASPERNPLLGDLFLQQSVPELAGDRQSGRIQLVSSCVWEPPDGDAQLEAWLVEDDPRPLLYVQPGPSFDQPRFWPRLVEALAGEPLRVVAAVGRMNGEVGIVPNNFFVRAHVPQTRVLGMAAGVVCSGTTTAVLGASTHGLPSLLLPAGGEQFELADDCESAGVARCLPPDAEPETIRQSVRMLLRDERMRRRASELQQAFVRHGGRWAAARALEQLGYASGLRGAGAPRRLARREPHADPAR